MMNAVLSNSDQLLHRIPHDVPQQGEPQLLRQGVSGVSREGRPYHPQQHRQ